MFLVDQNGKHDKLLLRSNGPNIKIAPKKTPFSGCAEIPL